MGDHDLPSGLHHASQQGASVLLLQVQGHPNV